MVKSFPDCGRSQYLCGAVGPACFSWCCWLFPGWSPPAPCLDSPLRSLPAPRPRGPPRGRGRRTSASHGADRPALPPLRSTGSRLPVHEVTAGNKYISSTFSLKFCFGLLKFISYRNSGCLIMTHPTSQWAAPVATVKADGYVRISAPCLRRASDNSGNLRS